MEQTVLDSNNALKVTGTQKSMNVAFVCRNIHCDQTVVSAREIQNWLLNCAPVTRNPYVFYVIGRGLEFNSRAEIPKNAKINWRFGCYSFYITISELIQNYAILNLEYAHRVCSSNF